MLYQLATVHMIFFQKKKLYISVLAHIAENKVASVKLYCIYTKHNSKKLLF